MPAKKFTSPFTSSFRTAVKKGTPASTAVANISKRTGKSPTQIFQSLFKADEVERQRFNGQWIFWPIEAKRSTSTVTKNAQVSLWQSFVDWAIASGTATPTQLENIQGSQQEFSSSAKRFFARQFSATTTSPRSSTRSSTRRTTSTTGTRRTRNLRFQGLTTTRRRAA